MYTDGYYLEATRGRSHGRRVMNARTDYSCKDCFTVKIKKIGHLVNFGPLEPPHPGYWPVLSYI